MARPLSRNPKHRREYVVLCIDPVSNFRKFFVCVGYKSLILKEYMNKYPECNISIYVLSSKIISNYK